MNRINGTRSMLQISVIILGDIILGDIILGDVTSSKVSWHPQLDPCYIRTTHAPNGVDF